MSDSYTPEEIWREWNSADSSVNDNKIGRAINGIRRRIPLSQTALGARLGVSTALVSQWERGQTRVDANDLGRLAHALQTTPAELIRAARFSAPTVQATVPPVNTTEEILLDRQEKYLVESYRSMSLEQQQLALRLFDALLA